MSYKIYGVDRSADGYNGEGVVSFAVQVEKQSDLAEIDWMKSGSFATDNAMTVYPKCPRTGHWVLPTNTPILITTQPVDVNTTAGAITESLSVEAYAQDKDAEYTPTYQWYSNNSKDYTTPSAVSGETAATMALDTELAAGTYYYYCTITANGKTLDSAIATVTVAAAE